MRGFALGLLAALVLASCGGASSEPRAPKADAAGEKQAVKEARSLVREIYDTLSRSPNTDGLMPLLAEPLVVFGPRRADAHATRSDALVAMRAILDEHGKDKRTQLSSSALAVAAGPSGHSAWAVDVITVDGTPMAVTAVLANEADFWVVVAASLAKLPSTHAIKSSLDQDAVVPTAVEAHAAVAGAADGAVDRFKRGLEDPERWTKDLTDSDTGVWIGASSGELSRGPRAVASLSKKRAKKHTRYALAGDLSANVTPDGALAWVTAPAVRFSDDGDALPLRLFGVFEHAGGGWRLAGLQESVALDEPGAGASFKKISAPALEPDEPASTGPAKKSKKPRKKASRGD